MSAVAAAAGVYPGYHPYMSMAAAMAASSRCAPQYAPLGNPSFTAAASASFRGPRDVEGADQDCGGLSGTKGDMFYVYEQL